MKAKSALPGKRTSDVEVTNVSEHGFWLLLESEELFLSFAHFPWFKDVPAAQRTNVLRPQRHHLHWPNLAINIAVDSIREPAKFPLIAKRG